MSHKIKLVIIEEHTLGYIDPEHPKQAGVLHESILRGAPFRVPASVEPISIEDKTLRLASKKDFEDFRVCFKGFDNPDEYEYAL